MRVGETTGALYAATRFDVESRANPRDGRAYARVRCDLETGRQHQIRIHLASLGTPIVGDKLYGPDDGCFARGVDGELTGDRRRPPRAPTPRAPRMAADAPAPGNGRGLAIEAPLPADIEAFWRDLA